MTIRTSTARRARLRERARRDILEAAAGVFARRGYAAATLADLARAAGYAAPSLYRYFGSKEEIFRSLIALLAAELRATFEEPVDPAAPLAARLERLLLAQHRLAEGRDEVLDLLISASDSGRRLVEYEKRLEGWLARHGAPGELRVPPDLAAAAATGILFALQHGARVRAAPAERARLATDLILNGVAR